MRHRQKVTFNRYEFVKRINIYTREHDLSDADIAGMIGYSHAYISKLKAGSLEPTLTFFAALAGVTGKSVAYWRGMEDEARNTKEPAGKRIGKRAIKA